MLNLFPLPDPAGLALDPTGNRGYNFRYPQQQLRPLDDKILRIDYNPSSKVDDLRAPVAGLPGAERLQRHGGPSRRRLGSIPGQLSRAGGGRHRHGDLHLQLEPDQRIQLGNQPRQAGRRSADRRQQQPQQRRREDVSAKPAAPEGLQRQRAHSAAHQPGQQHPGPAAGGKLRLPQHRFQRAIFRPGHLGRAAVQPGQPLAFHRHRPATDHPGQNHLGQGFAHAESRLLYGENGAQRQCVLGVQRGRNLLLRLRPRQFAGHQLSLLQRAAGQHLRLRRRQYEAGEPRALHAGRVVRAGHVEGQPPAHPGLRPALLSRRRPELGAQQSGPVRHLRLRRRQGRPVALPGVLDSEQRHLPDGQQDRRQPGDGRDLPLRPAGHVRHLFLHPVSLDRHQVLRHPLLQRASD